MPPAIFESGPYADRFRNCGCLRVRITDRKLLPAEREKIDAAASTLGRRAYTSYRYPYLYARLGERLDDTACHEGPTVQSVLYAERLGISRSVNF